MKGSDHSLATTLASRDDRRTHGRVTFLVRPLPTKARPMPPVESKQKKVRYVHIHEGEPLNEVQLKKWIKQAAAQPDRIT